MKGDKGDTGDQGPQGNTGAAATIAVGSVSKLAPGSTPTVVNAGNANAAVFDFGIPQGEKGEKGDTGSPGQDGDQGPQGVPGNAATIVVNQTTTLSAGSDATVSNVGTSNAARLNFGIPRGEKGDTPQKGTDYWTDTDKQEIVDDVLEEIPNAAASTPGLITLNQVDNRMSAPVVTLGGSSSAYTGTISGPAWASYLANTTGHIFVVIPSVTSTTTSVTLNINSFGAKNIRRLTQTGTVVAIPTSGYFRLNVPYLMVYDGTQYLVVSDTQPYGSSDFVNAVAIAKGGTGGTSQSTAWTNIGVPSAATAAPLANGTANVGDSTKWAREDHVHPLQTTVSGNAGTATTLQTSRTLWGRSFNGSGNVSGAISGTGNITPTSNNASTVGTSSLKYSAMYATTFYGALSGNATTATSATSATTATKLSASKTWKLAGNVTGSGSGDLSGNITINVTSVTATALASSAKEVYCGTDLGSAPSNATCILIY